jgi:thiol-disulfide isomerase/thioredoxin
MRHVDGSGPVKISESHAKVVVLNFWTTWCVYCNSMETLLADVRAKFAGRDDVVFLTVNADEDESLVASYLQQQKVGGTAVFADGVNQAFHVESIPTILVLDKSGKIAYRTQGFAPDGFTDLAIAAITKASAPLRPRTQIELGINCRREFAATKRRAPPQSYSRGFAPYPPRVAHIRQPVLMRQVFPAALRARTPACRAAASLQA